MKHQHIEPKGHRLGAGWRWTRRFTQLFMLLAVVLSPLMGGWQRLERYTLAAWDPTGWELSTFWVDLLPQQFHSETLLKANRMMGGGAATDMFTIPGADPLAGFIALFTPGISTQALLAWGVTALLAIFLGRAFCGWLCPFGVLARLTDRIRGYWPGHFRTYKIPESRPLRFIIMGLAIFAGAVGLPSLLFLFLPHVLLQNSVYSLWLLGGGGAALGALVGLILAGLIFGPTTYCATLCPTGASLSLLGRFKPLRMGIDDKPQCGGACHLCDVGCWLGLKPSTGDPGPDCDLCGRCTEVCPRTNMSIQITLPNKKSPAKSATKTAAVLLITAAMLGGASTASADVDSRGKLRTRPSLVMESTQWVGDKRVVVSVTDIEGIRLSYDIKQGLKGSEVSVFIGVGEIGEADRFGVLPSRDVYQGPMTITLKKADGSTLDTMTLDKPNHPVSAARPRIYRKGTLERMGLGDQVIVDAEWLDTPMAFTVGETAPGKGTSRTLGWILVGFLGYGGLLAMALGVGHKKEKLATA